jgi:hypothetical protein
MLLTVPLTAAQRLGTSGEVLEFVLEGGLCREGDQGRVLLCGWVCVVGCG